MFEVSDAVSGLWGSDLPGLRISPLTSYNDMIDSDPVGLATWLAGPLNPFDLANLDLMRGDFFGNVVAAAGFEIVGISLDSDQKKLETFIKQKNMTWPQFFDGKLTPFLLVLSVLAFFFKPPSPQEDREKKILASFALLYFFLTFFQEAMRVRYIVPIVPPLVDMDFFC